MEQEYVLFASLYFQNYFKAVSKVAVKIKNKSVIETSKNILNHATPNGFASAVAEVSHRVWYMAAPGCLLPGLVPRATSRTQAGTPMGKDPQAGQTGVLKGLGKGQLPLAR